MYHAFHKIFFVNIEKIVNNGGLIVIYRIMQGGLALNVLHSEVGAAINQLLDEDHTFKLASYVKAWSSQSILNISKPEIIFLVAFDPILEGIFDEFY